MLSAALGAKAADTFSSEASDLWWNPNESGWGINIEQQRETIFATLFVYGADGRAHWYVAPQTWSQNPANRPITFSGPLYETTGPAFSASFNPNAVITRQVGTLSFAYTPTDSAHLTYSVDGVTVTKDVVRQTWRNVRLDDSYRISRNVTSYGAPGCPYGPDTYEMYVSQEDPSVGTEIGFQWITPGTITPRCRMEGTKQQHGRITTITGTADCNGTTGPFTFEDMEIGVRGFTGFYRGPDMNGCTIAANVAGVSRYAPQP